MTLSEIRFLAALDPEDRPMAREWMAMPEPEFRGRTGLALQEIRDRLDGMALDVGALRQPLWRQLAARVGVFAGGVLAGFAGGNGGGG